MPDDVVKRNVEEANRSIRLSEPGIEDSLTLTGPAQMKKSDSNGIIPVWDCDIFREVNG